MVVTERMRAWLRTGALIVASGLGVVAIMVTAGLLCGHEDIGVTIDNRTTSDLCMSLGGGYEEVKATSDPTFIYRLSSRPRDAEIRVIVALEEEGFAGDIVYEDAFSVEQLEAQDNTIVVEEPLLPIGREEPPLPCNQR